MGPSNLPDSLTEPHLQTATDALHTGDCAIAARQPAPASQPKGVHCRWAYDWGGLKDGNTWLALITFLFTDFLVRVLGWGPSGSGVPGSGPSSPVEQLLMQPQGLPACSPWRLHAAAPCPAAAPCVLGQSARCRLLSVTCCWRLVSRTRQPPATPHALMSFRSVVPAGCHRDAVCHVRPPRLRLSCPPAASSCMLPVLLVPRCMPTLQCTACCKGLP